VGIIHYEKLDVKLIFYRLARVGGMFCAPIRVRKEKDSNGARVKGWDWGEFCGILLTRLVFLRDSLD